LALQDALTALQWHWDDVRGRLDDETHRRLRGWLQELRAVQGDSAACDQVAAEVVRLLRAHLPAGHPVLLAADLAGARPAVGERELLEWESIVNGLGDLVVPRSGDGEASDPAFEGWLLAAPALPVLQVAAGRCDPFDPGLIRLPDPDGRLQLPAFQFDDDGQPYAAVAAVNRLLLAADDPWGAADWWLGVHGRLGVPPASVVTVSGDLLPQVASDELAED
jgi:hypothetical protein